MHEIVTQAYSVSREDPPGPAVEEARLLYRQREILSWIGDRVRTGLLPIRQWWTQVVHFFDTQAGVTRFVAVGPRSEKISVRWSEVEEVMTREEFGERFPRLVCVRCREALVFVSPKLLIFHQRGQRLAHVECAAGLTGWPFNNPDLWVSTAELPNLSELASFATRPVRLGLWWEQVLDDQRELYAEME